MIGSSIDVRPRNSVDHVAFDVLVNERANDEIRCKGIKSRRVKGKPLCNYIWLIARRDDH